MIPVVEKELGLDDLFQDDYKDKTHKLKYKDAVIGGYCDKLDALAQSIFFMLTTERYQFPIYSDNYGIKLIDLFGQPMGLVKSELERRITDCLMTDNRIDKVDGFRFKRKKRALFVTFNVHSNIGGSLTYRMGVDI